MDKDIIKKRIEAAEEELAQAKRDLAKADRKPLPTAPGNAKPLPGWRYKDAEIEDIPSNEYLWVRSERYQGFHLIPKYSVLFENIDAYRRTFITETEKESGWEIPPWDHLDREPPTDKPMDKVRISWWWACDEGITEPAEVHTWNFSQDDTSYITGYLPKKERAESLVKNILPKNKAKGPHTNLSSNGKIVGWRREEKQEPSIWQTRALTKEDAGKYIWTKGAGLMYVKANCMNCLLCFNKPETFVATNITKEDRENGWEIRNPEDTEMPDHLHKEDDVAVLFRVDDDTIEEAEAESLSAESWLWATKRPKAHIIAYKVIKKYKPKPKTPEEEGFQVWDPKKTNKNRPFPGCAEVEVILKNGTRRINICRKFGWKHLGADGDITHVRLNKDNLQWIKGGKPFDPHAKVYRIRDWKKQTSPECKPEDYHSWQVMNSCGVDWRNTVHWAYAPQGDE